MKRLPDDTRQVRILDTRQDGTVEHTVTQAFLNMKAREFWLKVVGAQHNHRHGERPRVCIAGYMDYLWLRSYCADYMTNKPLFDTAGCQSMPEDFPKHFRYRGILVIEALENETGYTFA
jgi:hypothetical protein